MKRQRYYIACVLFIIVVAIFVACSPSSKQPFVFVPDSAKVIRMPNRGWVVYVFPADFNNIMLEVKSELIRSGFIEAGAPFDDPNEVRRFHKRYVDGSVHEVEIYNKKLGSAGKQATAGKWVSISSHDDHYFELRIKRLIKRIERFISNVL